MLSTFLLFSPLSRSLSDNISLFFAGKYKFFMIKLYVLMMVFHENLSFHIYKKKQQFWNERFWNFHQFNVDRYIGEIEHWCVWEKVLLDFFIESAGYMELIIADSTYPRLISASRNEVNIENLFIMLMTRTLQWIAMDETQLRFEGDLW